MENNNLLNKIQSLYTVSENSGTFLIRNAYTNAIVSKSEVKELLKFCEIHLDVPTKKINEINEKYIKLSQEKISQSTKQKVENHGYVYVIKSEIGYKIGRSITKKRPEKLSEVLLPIEMKIVLMVKVKDYIESEAILHGIYDEKRIKGEWFKLTDDDIYRIENYLLLYKVED